MSDTPTPADTCPLCGSDDRGDLYGNEDGSRCPDPWHSSPVPAADTPNPAREELGGADERLATLLDAIARIHTPEELEAEVWRGDADHGERFPDCPSEDDCEGHLCTITVCSECGYEHDGETPTYRHWPCPTVRAADAARAVPDRGGPMSDTPTPADSSADEPNFEGHDPDIEHRTVGPHRAWSFASTEWCYPASPCAHCEQAMRESPVDSPEADTPNPGPTARQVIARTLLDHWGPTFPQDECDCCTAEVLAALAAAGLRVVQVPDGLPERLRDIAEGMDQVGGFNEDAGFVRAAAALLGGEGDR